MLSLNFKLFYLFLFLISYFIFALSFKKCSRRGRTLCFLWSFLSLVSFCFFYFLLNSHIIVICGVRVSFYHNFCFPASLFSSFLLISSPWFYFASFTPLVELILIRGILMSFALALFCFHLFAFPGAPCCCDLWDSCVVSTFSSPICFPLLSLPSP